MSVTADGPGRRSPQEPTVEDLRASTREELARPELPDEDTVSKAAVYLNRKLPKTRTIAQALIRDGDDHVLLCQLAYKKFWDLPGGVVDPHESPASAVVRELTEELGVNGTIRALRVVSWLPPWRGWDDAMLYVFEVDVDRPVAEFALQRKEIAAVHSVSTSDLDQHVAQYTAAVVRQAVKTADEGRAGVYLENGEFPDWALGAD